MSEIVGRDWTKFEMVTVRVEGAGGRGWAKWERVSGGVGGGGGGGAEGGAEVGVDMTMIAAEEGVMVGGATEEVAAA